MKVTIIARYLTSTIQFIENKIDAAEGKNYNELIAKALSLVGDNSSFIKSELDKRGYEVQFVFANWTMANSKWAEEHRLKGGSNEDIVVNGIIQFRPDAVFIGSYFNLFDSVLPAIKRKLDARVIAWISCPLPEAINLSCIDKVFTSLPSHVRYFSDKSIDAEESIIGFPKGLKFDGIPKTIDVGFIGAIDGLFTKVKYHTYRTELIKYLGKRIEIHKWGYGYQSTSKLKSIIKFLLNDKGLYRNFHGEVWGLDMLKTLASFKIGLNCHGEVADKYAVNHRIFETTGVGTLLLTDEKEYLSKYFIPGEEVITYKSPEDCLEKIRDLLESPDKIEKISKAGHLKTVEKYPLGDFVTKLERSF